MCRTLIQMILEVIDSLTIKEQEIQDTAGPLVLHDDTAVQDH